MKCRLIPELSQAKLVEITSTTVTI